MKHATGPLSSQSQTTGESPVALLDAEYTDPKKRVLRNTYPDTPVNTHSACPLCDGRSAQIIANRDGKTREKMITISCSDCGLGRVDPLPTNQELAEWYATQYRQAYKSAAQPVLRHVLRAGRNAQWRWQWLCQNTVGVHTDSNTQSKRSLDIGSSSGEFVYLLHTLGFQAKGIEPHAGYAAYARNMLGIDINNGTLQHCLPSELPVSFDLISMFHVLEHLPEPVSALRTIGEKLKPEGLLYIEVPNATRLCSPNYMFFKAHTLYFTGKALRNLLEKCGFRVVSHNPDDSDNLSVVAQFVNSHCPLADSDPSHPLVSAQQARRWAPYLLQQLREGQTLRKWRKRQEEKQTAAKYANGLELLKDLYESKVT
jgi:2-polyprenyl-3-methyl-5-hydroxy-6-metoxy-1,4-benzoquinol methylase